jgi:hypothetical protein
MEPEWLQEQTPQQTNNLEHPMTAEYKVKLQRIVLQGLEYLALQGKDEKIKYQALSRLAELSNLDPKVGPVNATQNNIIVDSKNSNGLQAEIAKLIAPSLEPEDSEVQYLIGGGK